MSTLTQSPFFGIALTLGLFLLGKKLAEKVKSPLINPLLFAIIGIVATLVLLDIPLAHYNNGAQHISLLLTPSLAAIGFSIYQRRALLLSKLVPILAGCLVGSVVSISSVIAMCKLFDIDGTIVRSLMPKSVTTPIALELSSTLGGISSLTVAAVVVTGICGAVFCPVLIKMFRLKDELSQGIAIGTCSHALGTTRALEISETTGAMSGVAIGISGIVTVILGLLLA